MNNVNIMPRSVGLLFWQSALVTWLSDEKAMSAESGCGVQGAAAARLPGELSTGMKS